VKLKEQDPRPSASAVFVCAKDPLSVRQPTRSWSAQRSANTWWRHSQRRHEGFPTMIRRLESSLRYVTIVNHLTHSSERQHIHSFMPASTFPLLTIGSLLIAVS